MRKKIQLDYTLYSAGYARESGECWDFTTWRGAKKKAKAFGAGARIVRNFNLRCGSAELEWWQPGFCWIWDGEAFLRRESVLQKKWAVPEEHWQTAKVIRRIRAHRRATRFA